MSGRQVARQLVESIARSHGYITEDRWQRLGVLDRELFCEFHEAFQSKDDLIGTSAITLARNLYSSNSRFVFELLQNADDNHFSTSTVEPYVSFKVQPDRIIVECNEDGFTKENLEAICNIGKSSKVGSHRYIGEKGIGFKSIFKVAYKALIQSGDFSFSFTHRKGDSGMGIISPQWEGESEDIPIRGMTRITLFLQKDDNPYGQLSSILEQFGSLNEEILLFTRNLKSIYVKIYTETGELASSTTYSASSISGTRAIAEKLVIRGGNTKRSKQHFHITKHVAENLSINENREYSETETASKEYSRSEIVLAFPLSENSVPDIKNNWVFAFMPIRQMGFKFVIQADFVTSASRQDIEFTSARNGDLSTGIVDAFIKGVVQLCDHPTLQYTWMRYVPSMNDSYPWDAFWSLVIARIGIQLQSISVLRPASLGPLKQIGNLRRHPDFALDRYGSPLFADTTPELYIAPGYMRVDLVKLGNLGLDFMDMHDIVQRVRVDLDSRHSRMKSSLDEDWHSRAAKLLQQPFKNTLYSHIQALKTLELVPLRTGGWTSVKNPFKSSDCEVYYSDVGGLEVPEGLGFKIVDPQACKNPERKKLFDYLGVERASVQMVCERISRVYFRFSTRNVDPATSLSHLQFLYQSRQHIDRQKAYPIKLVTQSRELCNPVSEDVYLPSNDALGAFKLLAPDDKSPGSEVTMLHDVYTKNIPWKPFREPLTWFDWLYDVVKVRRNLRLVNFQGNGLSVPCRYVAKYRPAKFMPLLCEYWDAEGPGIVQNKYCLQELRSINVLCHRGWAKLEDTYVPTEHLKTIATRFMKDDDFFPWLELENPFDQPSYIPKWEKVSRDVGFGLAKTEMEFAISLLEHLAKSGPSPSSTSLSQRTYDLYCFVEAKIRESSDINSAREQVRSLQNLKVIYHPSSHTNDIVWYRPSECVWGRPPVKMATKIDLEGYFAQTFDQFKQDRSHLSSFFHNTLNVRNWRWEDIVDELKILRSVGANEFEMVIALYKCLNDMSLKPVISLLKGVFTSEPLICSFVDNVPTWHTLPECLWSSVIRIPGKVTLNNDHNYDGLEPFFLHILGVQEMTIQLIYDKLKDKKITMSVEEVRRDLTEFSALLLSTTDKMDPSPVYQNAVFPVRFPNGNVQLLSGVDTFAIADRGPLAADFANKAKFLDFSMDDVRPLQAFVEWVGLEDRYLSRVVEESFSADKTSLRPISQPDRDIRRKAHALLRIAITFRSPKAVGNERAFYSILQNCETFETRSITTHFQLIQGNESPVVDKVCGTALQIDDGPDGLKVFVPKRKKDREACFHTKLPQHLFAWIMGDPEKRSSIEGVKVVQSILTANYCALSSILDENGISSVTIPCEEEEEEEDSAEEETVSGDEREGTPEPPFDDDDTTLANASSQLESDAQSVSNNLRENEAEGRVTSPPNASTFIPDGVEDVTSVTARSAVLRARSETASVILANRLSASTTQPRPPLPHNPGGRLEHQVHTVDSPSAREREGTVGQHVARTWEEGDYLDLLNRVIAAARQSRIPSRGTFDMSLVQAALAETMENVLQQNSPFILRSASQLERDKRVGAAGELFVFEMLSRLNPALPHFDRSNWKSTIRSYVTIHPQYSTMSPWEGRETADITYQDVNGAFTSLLADRGYMDTWNFDIIRQVRPEYFIEVKSTTGPCEMPFFMSKYQYRRMQDYSQTRPGRDTNFDRIYVIFRVYNLGQESAGVKILVDPESMRQRGELAFTAENWSVRPAVV